MQKINVVLADDHLLVLEGLKALLSAEPSLSIEAALQSGNEVLEYLKAHSIPDILILDINMPELDGIELTARLKVDYPSLKILILSMYNRKEFVAKLISLGADGYIMKNSDKSVILSAIQTLSQGNRYFSPHLDLGNAIHPAQNSLADGELTEREKEVAELVTKGYNSNEIAEKLHLSPYTIDSHRRRILSKIQGTNSADIIRYAIKTGIVKDYRL